MQDGASSHTAKKVKEYLRSCDFQLLEPRPANSPGLTPTDYSIWGILQWEVEAQKPKTEAELKVAIRRAVAGLELRAARRAVDQSPSRLKGRISAEGRQFERKMRAGRRRGASGRRVETAAKRAEQALCGAFAFLSGYALRSLIPLFPTL